MSGGGGFGEMGSGGRSYPIDITVLLRTQAKGEFRIPSSRNTFPIGILSRLLGSISLDLKNGVCVVWVEA